MAICKNCGTNVGCSCSLVDGLCAACRAKINTPPPPPQPKSIVPPHVKTY